MTKRILPRVLTLAFFLLLWLMTGIISIYRTQDGSNDFDTFYEPGKSVLEGRGIYYIGEYYQLREGMGPFLYPPAAACFFALFAFLPASAAAFLWNTALLLLFGGSLVLTFKFLGVAYRDLPGFLWSVPLADRLFFCLIVVIMLVDNLVMAQINIPVFFLCLTALVLWRGGKNLSAGFILSLAIFLKLTPVFFCLYFAVKRAWKLLAGVLLGALAFSILIPTLIFGWETNRIYHRQWLGRMVKPMAIDFLERGMKEERHPLKKSPDELRDLALTQMLIDTNQSLEAALTRLFLKDRNRHQVTHRYEKLPVVAGGVSRDVLLASVRAIEIILLLIMMALWLKGGGDRLGVRMPLEVSLVFLSMTLLSPISRSHYFIVWVFAYAALFLISMRRGQTGMSKEIYAVRAKLFNRIDFSLSAKLASFFYLLLAFPYGEAVGVGAWANLIFWIGCAGALKSLRA